MHDTGRLNGTRHQSQIFTPWPSTAELELTFATNKMIQRIYFYVCILLQDVVSRVMSSSAIRPSLSPAIRATPCLQSKVSILLMQGCQSQY